MKHLSLTITDIRELRSVINTVLAYTSLNFKEMSIGFEFGFTVDIHGDTTAIAKLKDNLKKKRYKTVNFI